jgi:uncharacterized membrane protein
MLGKKLFVFLYAMLVFLIIDYIWLTMIANEFFQHYLGHMMREQVLMLPAFAFYVIFNFGLCVFVIYPNLPSKNVKMASILGALFGFVCYSSFDFTSYAVFKGYPAEIIAVDILWGAALGALTSAIVVKTFNVK